MSEPIDQADADALVTLAARARDISATLVREMGADNDLTFNPTSEMLVELNRVVCALICEGLAFSEEEIRDITCGDPAESNFREKFDLQTLEKILCEIFEGPTIG